MLFSARPACANGVAYDITGLSSTLLDNANAHLAGLSVSCAAPRWQVDALIPRAETAVRTALQALGHYKPIIHAAAERQHDCWRFHIAVQAGPAIRITRLDLKITGAGKDDPGLLKLLHDSSLKIGSVLDQGAYGDLKTRLERYAREHGYFDAHFTAHVIRIDPPRDSADIQLALDTGSRYAFGPTTLDQHVLNPALVLRLLSYHQGEPYSNNAIVESQNTLVGTGYFDSVRVQTQTSERRDGRVPMRLSLTPARRYQLQAGVGYSTDTGPRLRIDFRNRRVNRAGQRYEITTQLSPVQSQAGIKYQIPLANPRTDWLTFESGYQYEKTDTALLHSWKLGATRTHLLADKWLQSLSLEYLREDSSVAGQSLATQLVIPGIGFSRTDANAPIYPTRGWSAFAELRGAAKGFLTDTTFVQTSLNLKDIHPLGSGSLLTRIDLGATAVDSVTNLPASLRFFAGGDRSVRGYAYQSLGPKDASGNIIGGKYLVTASAEYDHHLYGNFYWATFYDVGSAFNSLPITPSRGIGVGLRWHSPLGPIRIDFAHPLDGRGNYLSVQMSMGPFL